MANVKMGKKVVRVSPWDGFKGLVTKHNSLTYDITYCPKTDRADLTVDGTLKFSDVSSRTVKRYAEINYGVTETMWTSK